jgi:hypothetical protein
LRRLGGEPLAVVPQLETEDDEAGQVKRKRARGRRKYVNAFLQDEPEV